MSLLLLFAGADGVGVAPAPEPNLTAGRRPQQLQTIAPIDLTQIPVPISITTLPLAGATVIVTSADGRMGIETAVMALVGTADVLASDGHGRMVRDRLISGKTLALLETRAFARSDVWTLEREQSHEAARARLRRRMTDLALLGLGELVGR